MATFTKEAIKKSFIELMKHKSVSKITVRDIVEHCGVNRNTFYYHYGSIPELVEDIISDIINSVVIKNAGVKSLEECLDMGAEIALKHKRGLLNIYNSANRNVYEIYLMRLCQELVEEYMSIAFAGTEVSPEDREILVRFYKCECFGQIIDWMNSSMSYNITEQFGRLCSLREGFADEIIKRCKLN